MPLKKYKPITSARRYYSVADYSVITKSSPEKSLVSGKSGTGGRNNLGRATNINKGKGHKKKYRVIDFKRNKKDIPAKVVAVEYDPNRTCHIALVCYQDGEKRYILAPQGIKVGDQVYSGEKVKNKVGNAMPLKNIPLGESVHNIEMKPGKGGQIAKSAGSSAQLLAKEGSYVLLKMPSGEIRKILSECYATLGVLSNSEHSNIKLGKAGRSRWLGRRPHTRGVAKNPVDHPMGGGEGKSSGGRHPCSPTGKPAKGYKTRSNKRTDKYIVRRASSSKRRS